MRKKKSWEQKNATERKKRENRFNNEALKTLGGFNKINEV